MSGCERHPNAFDPQCPACTLEAELRAMPLVEPPAGLAGEVVAAIAGEDAALEARLRSVPAVEPPPALAERVDAAIADAELEDRLRAVPMVEPPAELLDAVDAAVAFEPIADILRATPMEEPPVDLAAAVLDELAYEDRLRRGAVWRAAGIAFSSAAAGMLLLTDPAGLSSAAASFFDRASAYVPAAERLGPVAELGDFTAPAQPGLADHVVSAFDSAQLALANGVPAEGASAWFGAGGLWWMVLGIAGLAALNGVIARMVVRRA